MKKKVTMLTLLFYILLNSSIAQSLFTVDQMKLDLKYYKEKLEENHPNLYMYSSKSKIDSYFDSLSSSLDSPLTDLEFYGVISLTSNIVKDGHTLILPSSTTTDYHNENSQFLPYQIGIHENTLYVKMDCTEDRKIPDGARISSINGISSNDIIEQLTKRQVRDGYNLAYPHWILDRYFSAYYSFLYGHPQTYEIVYIENNTSNRVRVNALKKDSINYYRNRNYPSLNSENEINSGLTLKNDSNQNYAILTIKEFHDDVLETQYNQNFETTISKYFDDIINSNVENLILDLRNNQGGDIKNGVFLLSYLLDKPFSIVNEYNCIKSKRLIKCEGPSMGILRPNEKQFNGKLFVLVNGGSFSNSVIVTSCLKVNNRALFIGTETGGNPNILAGYGEYFELPNTKMIVDIPTLQFLMTALNKNNGIGLIPDHIVRRSIPDILHQNDTQLNFILDYIKKKTGNK